MANDIITRSNEFSDTVCLNCDNLTAGFNSKEVFTVLK